MALIDVRDTGAVGARILADPALHAGKTYEFTADLRRPCRSARRCSAGRSRMSASRPSSRAGHEVARHAGLAGGASCDHRQVGVAGGFSTENTG